VEASEALDKERISLDTFRTLQVAERAALPGRLEALGEEVAFVKKRERDAQEVYRLRREELESVRKAFVNGGH
jgi:pre-mRNA-splicing factor CDC5/CEF1